jgi:hypothetical protein
MTHGKQNGLGSACLMLAGMLALVASPLASAQQVIPVAVTPAAGEAQLEPEVIQELEEVVVEGGRLYDRIVRAEDRFFKLYNELNKEDDFDTNCAFVPIDQESRMEQRFCMPAFFADAKAEQVRLSQYCLSLTARDEEGQVLSQGACYEPPSAELIFFDRRKAYVDNVIKLIDSDPRLKDMASELDSLHRQRDTLARKYDDIKAQDVALKSQKQKYRPTVR